MKPSTIFLALSNPVLSPSPYTHTPYISHNLFFPFYFSSASFSNSLFFHLIILFNNETYSSLNKCPYHLNLLPLTNLTTFSLPCFVSCLYWSSLIESGPLIPRYYSPYGNFIFLHFGALTSAACNIMVVSRVPLQPTFRILSICFFLKIRWLTSEWDSDIVTDVYSSIWSRCQLDLTRYIIIQRGAIQLLSSDAIMMWVSNVLSQNLVKSTRHRP